MQKSYDTVIKRSADLSTQPDDHTNTFARRATGAKQPACPRVATKQKVRKTHDFAEDLATQFHISPGEAISLIRNGPYFARRSGPNYFVKRITDRSCFTDTERVVWRFFRDRGYAPVDAMTLAHHMSRHNVSKVRYKGALRSLGVRSESRGQMWWYKWTQGTPGGKRWDLFKEIYKLTPCPVGVVYQKLGRDPDVSDVLGLSFLVKDDFVFRF